MEITLHEANVNIKWLELKKPEALTEFKLVRVHQEIWQIEKLWNQFLNIGHVCFRCRMISLFDCVKHSIGQIKMSALKSEEMLGEWLHSD